MSVRKYTAANAAPAASTSRTENRPRFSPSAAIAPKPVITASARNQKPKGTNCPVGSTSVCVAASSCSRPKPSQNEPRGAVHRGGHAVAGPERPHRGGELRDTPERRGEREDVAQRLRRAVPAGEVGGDDEGGGGEREEPQDRGRRDRLQEDAGLVDPVVVVESVTSVCAHGRAVSMRLAVAAPLVRRPTRPVGRLTVRAGGSGSGRGRRGGWRRTAPSSCAARASGCRSHGGRPARPPPRDRRRGRAR